MNELHTSSENNQESDIIINKDIMQDASEQISNNQRGSMSSTQKKEFDQQLYDDQIMLRDQKYSNYEQENDANIQNAQ